MSDVFEARVSRLSPEGRRILERIEADSAALDTGAVPEILAEASRLPAQERERVMGLVLQLAWREGRAAEEAAAEQGAQIIAEAEKELRRRGEPVPDNMTVGQALSVLRGT
ncbi:hypothetical protein [Rubrobacter xylanophilus]|nr:hypothetical protein [Rubrobacter xylanophilus]